MSRELHRADESAMRRLFVVEVEVVALMTDGMNALVEPEPRLSIDMDGRKRPAFVISRRDRILREGVEDVGVHQLLMLLFVIEADFHQRRDLAQFLLVRIFEECDHLRIDILTIGGDGLAAWSRQMPALRARMTGASADVIGSEENCVVRVKDLVARHMLAELEVVN